MKKKTFTISRPSVSPKKIGMWLLQLCVLVSISFYSVAQETRPAGNTGLGFFVKNGKIYDKNGAQFIIRGVNNNHFWDENPASIPAIAKTKANAVRIVTSTSTTSPAQNQAIVESYIANQLVPIVYNSDATCKEDAASLTSVVNNWLVPASVSWIKRYEDKVIINITNEWGPFDNAVWRDQYKAAITKFRNAGINALLMIDAGGACGQNPRSLLNVGQQLIDFDPQHNIVFSIHMYGFWRTNERLSEVGAWNDSGSQDPWSVEQEIPKLVTAHIPFVVGEFSIDTHEEVQYKTATLLQVLQTNGIGWTAWMWYNGGAPTVNIVKNWVYNSDADLTPYGQLIVNNATFGLKATSVKPNIWGTTPPPTDTQAPSVPTGLSSPGKTTTSVSLSWSASTDNAGGSGVAGYDVYRGTVLAGSTGSANFTVTGLTPGTAYSFTVRAKDVAGNISAASSPLSVTTNSNPVADTIPPTGISNIISTAKTTTSVSLAWAAATDNVGVTGYNVYNGAVLAGTTTTTNFTVSGLTPGTTYSFSFRARDAAGNLSVASAPLSVTTNPTPTGDTLAPSAPANLIATATTSTSVSLSWNPSTDNVAVTGYDVYQGTVIIASIGTTSQTVGNLSPGTTYSFSIRARDAAGNVSSPSNPLIVTTSAATTAGSYRYLRIVFTGGSSLEIADVKWLGTGASYPASPFTSNGTRIVGFDGDAYLMYDSRTADGVWVGTASGQAITLDMLSPVAVNGVRIQLPSWGTLTGFRCEGSNNNSTWTVLLTKTGISQTGTAPVTYNFAGSTSRTTAAATTTVTNPLSVFPNPASGLLNVQYVSEVDAKVAITITDFANNTLNYLPASVKKGTNSFSIPVNKLRTGVYVLHVDKAETQIVIGQQ